MPFPRIIAVVLLCAVSFLPICVEPCPRTAAGETGPQEIARKIRRLCQSFARKMRLCESWRKSWLHLAFTDTVTPRLAKSRK